jgi:hypothetical protein
MWPAGVKWVQLLSVRRNEFGAKMPQVLERPQVDEVKAWQGFEPSSQGEAHGIIGSNNPVRYIDPRGTLFDDPNADEIAKDILVLGIVLISRGRYTENQAEAIVNSIDVAETVYELWDQYGEKAVEFIDKNVVKPVEEFVEENIACPVRRELQELNDPRHPLYNPDNWKGG